MNANNPQTLYCPELEHDNCGIGAVVNIRGEMCIRDRTCVEF